MNTNSYETYVLPRWMRGWEQFWYAPADPTLLALVRISCGLIVIYTMVVYSFRLQEYMGVHAWHDLQFRREQIEERPVLFAPLDWSVAGALPEPKNKFEEEYRKAYRKKWGFTPPPPYPANQEEADYLDYFRGKYNIDLRINGLPIPQNAEQKDYAEIYTGGLGQPPPAYIKDEAERAYVMRYADRWGIDPRRLYTYGLPVFSIWFHVTDPTAMTIVHAMVILVSILFTIGFCTRFTSALMWFTSLCYIHRNPTSLFGVDTMMTILLLYLMIGPSGAAYSVDRLIRTWWVKAKPGVVAWWYGLLRRPVPPIVPADPVPEVPTPSIGANVAIRLMQIHVCIVYLYAGLSKLQGKTWWSGDALWLTLGNYEFAPMQFELYLNFLRFLGKHQLVYDAFMTGGGMFTLVFEIGYPFLVWRPRLRWMFIGAAIILHGGIGLFMGLKTFSLMMLVMNMAFLRKEEVVWLLSAPATLLSGTRPRPVTQAAPPTPAPVK